STPYDQATAIEAYLRRLTYSTTVAPPPPGQDGVEHFLFTTGQGYCDYFASAMAVMLRSVGVPARVVSGYQSGDKDPETGRYVVREANAHTWVEVFFPDYGRVGLEPAPSRPVPERELEDQAPALPETSTEPEPEPMQSPVQNDEPSSLDPISSLRPSVEVPGILPMAVGLIGIGLLAFG